MDHPYVISVKLMESLDIFSIALMLMDARATPAKGQVARGKSGESYSPDAHLSIARNAKDSLNQPEGVVETANSGQQQRAFFMAYETIIVDVEDHVAQITLNRPDALNALNDELMSELANALTAAQNNDKVRCIILTGSEKAFAAGADISMMKDKSFVEVFSGDLFTAETEEIMRVRKPIIAAVSGYALGGGCELAMMCDFIICSETAKFGQPEINLGVVAGLGGTQRLTRLVGKSKAMDMNLTGRFMDAEEAERSGLVSRVVPCKKLMDEAHGAAQRIAEKSMVSVMVVKEAVNRAYETTLREGLLFERRMFHSLFATEDQKEGMSAFVEKREAQFRDR